MMTKKCYAHIKTSIEMSNAVKELTTMVQNGRPDLALYAIQEIAKLNNKFNIQFRDTNPDWLPPNANKYGQRYYGYKPPVQGQAQTPVQAPAPQVMIYEMENGDFFTQ